MEDENFGARQPSNPVEGFLQPTETYKKHKFQKFLANLSDQYLGNRYQWLKFLLCDHLTIAVLSKTNFHGMHLFNELYYRGHISFTNVTILEDITDVTELVAAKQCVEDYKQETQCQKGKGLTVFRKKLFQGLMQVTDSEIDKLVDYYNINYLAFYSIWDLVFHLELKKELDSRQKWRIFADFLNNVAKAMITDALKFISADDLHSTSPPDTPQWNPAESTVPLEIFDRGFETVKAFNEALKEGTAEVKQGRLIVMGLERVGKTSTIKSFLKKEFNPEEPYTDGIAENKTYIQDSDVWNEAPEGVSPFIVIYKKEVEKKMKEQKVFKQEQPSSSSSTSSSSPSKEEIPEGIASEAQTFGVTDEAASDFKIPENAFIMNIWDFGGQPIYSVIQRMLFASFAVVCVVFSFEHDLDRCALVRDPTTGEFYEHRMTYLDFIICCIRSVYMNGNRFELDGILCPPILLVGTHCNSLKLGMTEDERKSKIEEISSKIWNVLIDKPYGKMVLKIFPIENSESFDKSGAADIMEEIFTLTKKMIKPLPLKWMLVLKKIQKLRKEHFSQNNNEMFKLIEQCGIKQDQHVVLQYLHNIGEIFYYPNDDALKDIIVIDIMQVVRLSIAIITIIKPKLQKPMLRDSWERLNTGILEKRLLIHVWEKFGVKDELVDFFASLLQRFGLICKKEVTEGQECVYYVLSRLKPVPDIPLPYDENRAISLFHDFSNYLPDHIFQRGVTKFIENFQMKNDNPKLHYEQVGLNIDKNHYVILNVVTTKQRRMFKTTIVRIGNPATVKEVDPEPSVCKEVLDFLQEVLTDLCPNDEEEVELKTYIHCTCCQDFHPVDDFNDDELECGSHIMDMTRYHYLFWDGAPPRIDALQFLSTEPSATEIEKTQTTEISKKPPEAEVQAEKSTIPVETPATELPEETSVLPAEKTATVVPPETPTAGSKEFDFQGGTLIFKNIRLKIPENAIEQGKKVVIEVGIVDDEEIPYLGPTETLLSPVIYCHPPGTVFNQECLLSFPHSIVDESSWKFTGLVKKGFEKSWREIKDVEGYNFYVKNGICFIELRHFCNHVVKGMGAVGTRPVHMKVADDWYGFIRNTYEIYVETWSRECYWPKNLNRYFTFALTSNCDANICVEDTEDGWTVEPKELYADKSLLWEHYACTFLLKSETDGMNPPTSKIWVKQNGLKLTPCIHIPHKNEELRASQPQFRSGHDGQPSPSEGNFNDLLFDVASTWKNKGDVNRLKVILCEFDIGKADIQKYNEPYDLLKLLIGPGIISQSNVNVLIEAAVLGGIQSVEPKIKENVPSFLGFNNYVIHNFSTHRKNLMNFGKKLGCEAIKNIAHLYEIKSPTDQWVLIFELERKGKLTEETKGEFIKKLRERGMEVEANALELIVNEPAKRKSTKGMSMKGKSAKKKESTSMKSAERKCISTPTIVAIVVAIVAVLAVVIQYFKQY